MFSGMVQNTADVVKKVHALGFRVELGMLDSLVRV